MRDGRVDGAVANGTLIPGHLIRRRSEWPLAMSVTPRPSSEPLPRSFAAQRTQVGCASRRLVSGKAKGAGGIACACLSRQRVADYFLPNFCRATLCPTSGQALEPTQLQAHVSSIVRVLTCQGVRGRYPPEPWEAVRMVLAPDLRALQSVATFWGPMTRGPGLKVTKQ